jgi:hypothetical protein
MVRIDLAVGKSLLELESGLKIQLRFLIDQLRCFIEIDVDFRLRLLKNS